MNETKSIPVLSPSERRTVKKLRELLVRHGNRCDLLTMNLERAGKVLQIRNWRGKAERERKQCWDELKRADRRLLLIAAEELNKRELA